MYVGSGCAGGSEGSGEREERGGEAGEDGDIDWIGRVEMRDAG